MRLVCAHHKGGVGKTTLAVHTAALLANGIERTLLMDCDSQGDSFYFFARKYPAGQGDIVHLNNLDVYYNRDRVRLATLSNYDHLIVDIDTAFAHAMDVIQQVNPNVILIPVNAQALAVLHLNDVLFMIANAEGKSAYPATVKVVPVGISKAGIVSVLKQAPKLPSVYKVMPRMKRLPKMDTALAEGRLIWTYPDFASLMGYFQSLVSC
ncbi:MAG: ParA family protein [Deltaproteobacteria bacterium]|nr:ParA family protein [Deltaproteobacteria bacterium]